MPCSSAIAADSARHRPRNFDLSVMLDFQELIKDNPLYTFHSHTQFCDGRATMREMAAAAVSAGFTRYGFTPHSPIPIESPCNMSFEDVDSYLAECRAIAAAPEFASCRFFAGMEVDYLGDDWGPASDYFRSLPLDYTIGSVHFIPSQDGVQVDIDGRFENFKERMDKYFRRDIEYVVDTFYRRSEAMIAAGGFDILGHFDKVGQNASYYAPGIEDSSFYRGCLDRMVALIIDKHLTIELNTKARTEHGRFFPSPAVLANLVEAGVPVVVNSDAHRPECINASRDEALRLLASIMPR